MELGCSITLLLTNANKIYGQKSQHWWQRTEEAQHNFVCRGLKYVIKYTKLMMKQLMSKDVILF